MTTSTARSTAALLLMLVCLPLLFACGGDDTTTGNGGPAPAGSTASDAPQPGEAEALIAQLIGPWKVVTFDGKPIPALPGQPEMEFFEGKRVAGFSGVNRFSTMLHFNVDSAGKIQFGPLAGTRMTGPAEAMEWEKLMRTRLGAIRTFDIRDNTLYLYAGDSEAMTAVRP